MALPITTAGYSMAIATDAAAQRALLGISIASGKTLAISNSLTLAGTDGSTLNIGAGGTLGTAAFTSATAYATLASANTFAEQQTFQKTGATALFYCPTASTGVTRTTFRAGPANGSVPFAPVIEYLNNAGTGQWWVGTQGMGLATGVPLYLDSGVSGLGSTRIQSNSVSNINMVSNTTSGSFTNGDGSVDGCVNVLGGVLSATSGNGQGALSTFVAWQPSSGSSPFNGIAEQSTLNIGASASGVSRSFWARSFLTKTHDHRSFENASGVTNNLRASAAATQANWLANHWTYAAPSSVALDAAVTVDVTGPPVAGTNVTQALACGVRVRTQNVGNTTLACGIHITAPTGGGNQLCRPV